MTTLTLSPLDASEAAGITFSYVGSFERTELGVVTFVTVAGAVRSVRETMRNTAIGVVPRTQSAVDVMAEVLS